MFKKILLVGLFGLLSFNAFSEIDYLDDKVFSQKIFLQCAESNPEENQIKMMSNCICLSYAYSEVLKEKSIREEFITAIEASAKGDDSKESDFFYNHNGIIEKALSICGLI